MKDLVRNEFIGLTGTCKITGYTGLIVASSQHITGCDQYLLKPPGLTKDGEMHDGKWLDSSRILILRKKKVVLQNGDDEEKGGSMGEPPAKS